MKLPRIGSLGSVLVICCLFVISPFACAPNTPETEDGGFLSGKPCAPPCFWGIAPGVTREDEVVQILKAQGLFQKCEAFDNEAESAGRGIICRPSAVITFKEDTNVVDAIGFKPSQVITVADAVTEYGSPDAVAVMPIGLPEHPRTVMYLYYDKIKAKLSLPEQQGITFRVDASTEIENIGYFDASSYDSLRGSLPKWDGYTEYECSGCF